MSEAESLLRAYASEIEADLGLRGIDISGWHRGEMSDRRLLNLLQGLPERSALKTALRDGDWPFDLYIIVAILNELRALRADLRAMIGGEDMPYDPVLSPRQRADSDDWRRSAKSVHEDVIAQLRGEKRN